MPEVMQTGKDLILACLYRCPLDRLELFHATEICHNQMTELLLQLKFEKKIKFMNGLYHVV